MHISAEANPSAAALPLHSLHRDWLTAVERKVVRFAAKRKFAVLTVFLLAVSARLAVLPKEPIPAPGVHDEFSNLLLADTLAHGRLTNPTHSMWIHFETFTENMRPTYCSIYYPAQGAFLAIGQVIFGHPFWGVVFSVALMCAAITWALQGWMPPHWAFLGGLIAIMRFGVFNYWADSYWGGAVAALGGALALGALPRIKRRQRIRDAVVMALGFALLANSRPYEGLIYSVPILICLAAFLTAKKAPPLRLSMRRIVLPIAVVMAFTFAFMGYFFRRTTGNAFRPPYLVNVATYLQEPMFIWGRLKPPPQYNHAAMATFYGGHHVVRYQAARNHPVVTVLMRSFEFWSFYIGLPLTIAFFLLGVVLPYGTSLRDLGPKNRFLVLLIVIFFVGLLCPVPYFSHYAAPITCAICALSLQAIRRLSIYPSRTGFWMSRTIIYACLLSFGVAASAVELGLPRERALALLVPHGLALRSDMSASNEARQQLVSSLHERGGKYLILEHRDPSHTPHDEWVFNDADIDASPIVWAREMTPERDKELINYFKDRKVFLLELDSGPPRLTPYPMGRINNITSQAMEAIP